MGEKRISASAALRLKKVIVKRTEKLFYWYGHTIALQPWKWIAGCLLMVVICSLGLLRFRQEKNPMELWIPQGSDFKRDTDWIIDTFKEGYRMQYVLVTAEDVLVPQVIQKVEEVRRQVVAMSFKNVTLEDVCFRIPAVKPGVFGIFDLFGRRKRSFFFKASKDEDYVAGLPFDPTLYLGDGAYCAIAQKLPKVCLEINLGQLWSNDEQELARLTKEDIITALNSTKISPVYGHPVNFEQLLGGVHRDDNGRIMSAKALLTVWMTHVNFSAVDMDETGNEAGTADWVTGSTLFWEEGYLNLLKTIAPSFDGTAMRLFYEAGRSYGDISSQSMFQDVGKLFVGSFLMFCFIQFVLPSRFNLIEMRVWLGCVGLFCILLAFITTVALCSLVGIPYGPVHTSLPFLLLGIGVDDMFVIVSCWKNLSPSQRKLKVEEQIAVTLSHAGISITVTSVTDVVAFLVGSFTILPSLHSFCIYTAVGIFVMYILQATVFVAFLALDEKRIQRGGNSILFCVEKSNFKRKELPVETFQAKVFGWIYSKFLLTKPIKVLVILATIGFTGICIKGNLELKQKFDPKWFLPNNSYLLQFLNQRNYYYPDFGKDGGVFVGQADYSQEIGEIHKLSLAIEEETTVVETVDSWTSGFIKYTKRAEGVDLLTENITQTDFSLYLSKFLWSPNGARFQKNFRFDGEFVCGKPAPPVTISSIDFVFKNFRGPEEHLPAMRRLRQLAKESNITSNRVAVWAKIFANWVTDEVIDRELYRNLAMALTCVMVCTGILIVDLQICFWIFSCVLLTLVDVAGFMYFWGLYIDIASCIALVLAVGLCVDFAAHVGHIFLTFTGSRQDRALNTVKYIGTATFNAAFSTLLALSVLGNSDAYIFQTFFKIFLLVILFGLFHGIVFLPVVLSLIGPPSYNEGPDVIKTPACEKLVDGFDNADARKKTGIEEDC